MHSPSVPRAPEPSDPTTSDPTAGGTGPAAPGWLVGGDAVARVGAQRPAPRSRRRRPRWPDLAAAVVFALAGAMFIAAATASEDGALRVDRTGGLPAAISARADQNTELQASVDDLTRRVDTLTAAGGTGTLLEETNEQIAVLSPVVGLTEVIGPGVTVSLDDAEPPQRIPEGFTGDDYIVHQEDVQGVVNALWRGGASGVTVMGQRLISTSAVRCVGNTVILQGQVYSPPFVIEAVGDVERLTGALAADESVSFFRDLTSLIGLGYAEQTHAELTLPAYTGPTTTRHSQVIP